MAVTTYDMVNSQHFGGALKSSIVWRYLVGRAWGWVGVGLGLGWDWVGALPVKRTTATSDGRGALNLKGSPHPANKGKASSP